MSAQTGGPPGIRPRTGGPPGIRPRTGGPSGMRPRQFGQDEFGTGMEKEPEEALSRRRLQLCLARALFGLTGDAKQEPPGGVESLATEEPHRSFVLKLQEQLQKMSDDVSRKPPVDYPEDVEHAQALVKQVRAHLALLQNELKKKPT